MNPNDPSDMYSMIRNYSAQFAKGLDLAKNITVPKDINEVIVAGIGGSALAPDLVYAGFGGELPVPFSVHRSYDLPKTVGPTTLVIGISFSGNTEETLSAVASAHQQNAQIIALASGGKLADFANEHNYPLVTLIKESPNFQPRMSSGYVVAALTQILINAGLLPVSARDRLLTMAIAVGQLNLIDEATMLADKLVGTIPLIYTSDRYWPVARIAKIKLNENSKVPCFWNVLPELNHNEMLGFTNLQGMNYAAVMLQDPDDHPRVNLRMEVLSEVLGRQGIGSTIIPMKGANYLEKIFSSLLLMDWVSYYLALRLGIDPTPVAMVEEFKAAMVK